MSLVNPRERRIEKPAFKFILIRIKSAPEYHPSIMQKGTREKVLEAIDSLGTASRNPEETYRGSGLFSIAEKDSLVGFELTMQEQMIHSAVFARQ